MRDLWHAEVLRTPLVRDACRVLLLHMATAQDSRGRHLMTETGRIRIAREQLADDLDINPKRVTDRIAEATRAGLLVKVGGGHNGAVAQYVAQLVEPRKVPAEPVPTSAPRSLAGLVKVPANGGPSESAEPVPTRGISQSPSVRKVPAEPVPHVRAHARAPYRSRDSQPAPAADRGTEPHHPPNSSNNDERPRRHLILAANNSTHPPTAGGATTAMHDTETTHNDRARVLGPASGRLTS